MVDEYDVYNELEEQRSAGSPELEESGQPEPWRMGAGSYILILLALFVDIIEIITTYSGVGVVIAVPLGFLVDAAIFLGVGLSKKARKQWWKFATGFVGENFPLLAQAIEWFPIRTVALIWMYRGMSMQGKEEKNENEQ